MGGFQAVIEQYISAVHDVQLIRYFSREWSSCPCPDQSLIFDCLVAASIILVYDFCGWSQCCFHPSRSSLCSCDSNHCGSGGEHDEAIAHLSILNDSSDRIHLGKRDVVNRERTLL